jgi:predicted RNase H-like HicB family nuclease/predicted DNA-binding protein
MASRIVAQYVRKPYARVIIPDDSGRYAAQVLEFPGCFAEGDTPEEAYKNLQEAAENWVDSARSQGMAIPDPFATQGYSGTISLRLPKSMHRRAAQYAQRDGVSLNQFLVSAIAARVGAEDLLAVLADRLDDRLARLSTRRTAYLRVEAIEEAVTEGAALLMAPGIGAPVFAREYAARRETQEVVAERETDDG